MQFLPAFYSNHLMFTHCNAPHLCLALKKMERLSFINASKCKPPFSESTYTTDIISGKIYFTNRITVKTLKYKKNVSFACFLTDDALTGAVRMFHGCGSTGNPVRKRVWRPESDQPPSCFPEIFPPFRFKQPFIPKELLSVEQSLDNLKTEPMSNTKNDSLLILFLLNIVLISM